MYEPSPSPQWQPFSDLNEGDIIMNPTLILCIASIVVEAALAVIKLMNKQK
jgi:hypothetical protein